MLECRSNQTNLNSPPTFGEFDAGVWYVSQWLDNAPTLLGRGQSLTNDRLAGSLSKAFVAIAATNESGYCAKRMV